MRYLPLTDKDRALMLKVIGKDEVTDLFASIPPLSRSNFTGLPDHKSELDVQNYITNLANKNQHVGNASSFLGCGAYNHHIPATVDHIIQRSEFLTSYTPYQPEIAQGTLQYLFEFQSQIIRLTGMEIANASLYDGSTACAEAALMALRISKRNKVLVFKGLHPHYYQVTKTYVELNDKRNIAIIDENTHLDKVLFQDCGALIIQIPDVFGNLYNHQKLLKQAKESGVLIVYVCTEIISLGLLKTPAEMGADIFVAEGQSLGSPLSFGGPYLGLFATKKKYLRQIPGRICGQTIDKDGKTSYVLTLSTREQHIRRDKATSNICTNSGLCALAFTIHLALLGGKGLQKLAQLNHQRAIYAYKKLQALKNIKILNKNFFNEFTIELPVCAQTFVEELTSLNILAGVPISRVYGQNDANNNLLVCAFTECNSKKQIDEFISAIDQYLNKAC